MTMLFLLLLTACSGDLARFERTLAAQPSATVALGEWCEARAIADPPTIKAQLVANAGLRASFDIRSQLDVDGNQSVAYRHVRLTCGESVLSVAHNWYVPSRLTPEMNRVLETTDTPFGKVVAPLNFSRRRLAAKRGPLPGCPRDTVVSHRAVLEMPGGRPLSMVVECYTAANIATR